MEMKLKRRSFIGWCTALIVGAPVVKLAAGTKTDQAIERLERILIPNDEKLWGSIESTVGPDSMEIRPWKIWPASPHRQALQEAQKNLNYHTNMMMENMSCVNQITSGARSARKTC